MSHDPLKVFEKLPDKVENKINMDSPNAIINIKEGSFKIKYKNKFIKIKGVLNFRWYPSHGVFFQGITSDNNSVELLNAWEKNDFVNIYLDMSNIGEALITQIKSDDTKPGFNVVGVLHKQVLFGDKSIPVQKVTFSIPNLISLYGSMVKKKFERKIRTTNRIIIKNKKFIINIDKSFFYRERKQELQNQGGYFTLYDGELVSKKGAIKYEEANECLYSFNIFMSFLNGRRVSALFRHGICDEDVKWFDTTAYSMSTYKSVKFCIPKNVSIEGLNRAWEQFTSLWENEDDKNFLISFIYWYTEANGSYNFVENALIMAQTALELVYNWWVVERKGIITGEDSKNISASNKIRLLLSQVQVDYKIPAKLNSLKKFVANSSNINDAPEAIVQIRNSIVHSQLNKRRKLSKISLETRLNALDICLWYMEISLLRIINYKGAYINRCTDQKETVALPINSK